MSTEKTHIKTEIACKQTKNYVTCRRVMVILIIALTVSVISIVFNGNKNNGNVSDTIINIAQNSNITLISNIIASIPRSTPISSAEPERNCSLPLCYLENENNGIFCRSKGTPQCWMPPTQCFQRSSACLMYIPSGGLGDVCAPNHVVINETNGWMTYTCQYIYKPPTPRPTPPPIPKVSMNHDIYKLAQQYDSSVSMEQYKPSSILSETSLTIMPTAEPTLSPTGNCSIPICYYDKPGTFARKKGNPECWMPPSCFQRSTMCLMYLSSGGLGDLCVVNHATVNQTTGVITYTCQYIYKPPTPKPTPPPNPPSTPPASEFDAFNSAEQYDHDLNNQQHDLLQYLDSYYSQNIIVDEEDNRKE